MVLPAVKLATLALKTISKPIANRLKREAGLHPRFRQFIVNIAQANHRFTTNVQRRIYGHATDVAIRPLNEEKAVGGAAVIFEVQRSSRSEARKEELRRQELEAMRQRDEDLAREVELLKKKLEELEQLAKGRGIAGFFNFRNAQGPENGKGKIPV
ncbi:unnamed protein product [Prunus armeniaca]|uniref:OPA3-like protein n=1 Tax=Prunus armeniaca TaxID=36596 RepID=A0A6J5UEC3_PRUAR|nr:unnamed protein product [Prunus armeniaca]